MAAVSKFVSGTSEKILTLSECLSRLHQMVPKFVPELIPVSDVAGISTLKESSVNMVANVTNPSALMADVAAGNEKKPKGSVIKNRLSLKTMDALKTAGRKMKRPSENQMPVPPKKLKGAVNEITSVTNSIEGNRQPLKNVRNLQRNKNED